MQLDHHLAQVHDQLGAAAALGDDRTKEVAAALSTAALPAVRLALLNAVSEAADEITEALLDYPGSPGIAVHLDGEQIAVEVRATAPAAPAEEPRRDEGDPSARISLRLTETLKGEIDAAAERDGVSVNTWLVRAASAALREDGTAGAAGFAFSYGPGAFAGPDFGGRGGGRGRGHHRNNHQRITGWING